MKSVRIITLLSVFAAMVTIILNLPSYVGVELQLVLGAFTLIIALSLAFQK